MKKIYLLLVMSLAFVFSALSAPDLAQELEMADDESMTARSLVFPPRATVSAGGLDLSVSFFNGDALYNVEILDESGSVVSFGTLVANGAMHFYTLMGLPEGNYTMRVSNSDKSYTGGFWL